MSLTDKCTRQSACQRVAELWNDVIAGFLRGEETHVRPPLDKWYGAYSGRGKGEVDLSCFPEPYLGDLLGSPRAAILALNPGGGVHEFQAKEGIFAKEIREKGSYREWAKSWPYLGGSWGKNRHHKARMTFLRRWFGDDTLLPKDRIDFELFPWHSQAVTGPMVPDPEIIREFIWEPLKELRVEFIFAFGRPWLDLLEKGNFPEVQVTDRIGEGGRIYASSRKKTSRTAVVKASTPWGGWLIIGKQLGFAGPPSGREIESIKHAFGFKVIPPTASNKVTQPLIEST